MDKEIHKITKRMQTAEGALRAGKKAQAQKVLKAAEKKNEALKRKDRDVRDPQIEKYKEMKRRGC